MHSSTGQASTPSPRAIIPPVLSSLVRYANSNKSRAQLETLPRAHNKVEEVLDRNLCAESLLYKPQCLEFDNPPYPSAIRDMYISKRLLSYSRNMHTHQVLRHGLPP